MKPIFLIGYMCSGKTTLGRAVGIAASLPFIDLDDLVEAHAGCTVREIFATHGEEAFREMERKALVETSGIPGGAIIACGGGTPCFGDNMDFMNSRGITVHLRVSDHERLMNRLREGRTKRPLIASLSDGEIEQFITHQMAARLPHYSRAQEEFDSSYLENEEEVAASAKSFISKFIQK